MSVARGMTRLSAVFIVIWVLGWVYAAYRCNEQYKVSDADAQQIAGEIYSVDSQICPGGCGLGSAQAQAAEERLGNRAVWERRSSMDYWRNAAIYFAAGGVLLPPALVIALSITLWIFRGFRPSDRFVDAKTNPPTQGHP